MSLKSHGSLDHGFQPQSKIYNTHRLVSNTTFPRQISIKHNISPPQQWRSGDEFFMEVVNTTNLYSQLELRLINEVRMYVKVLFVSDICHADGFTVRRDILHAANTLNTCSGLAFQWPNTAAPTKKMVELWRQVLHDVFGIDQYLRIEKRFQLVLWSTHAQAFWIWWQSPNEKYLYKKEENAYIIYHRKQQEMTTSG
jgi:hypothetical protein